MYQISSRFNGVATSLAPENTSADVLNIIRLERYSYQPKLEEWYPQMPEVHRISTVPEHTSADVSDINRFEGLLTSPAPESTSADVLDIIRLERYSYQPKLENGIRRCQK